MRVHVRIGCTVLLAAVLAAACGNSDSGSSGAVKKSKAPAKPKVATPPERDTKLDEKMGEAGEAARAAGCTFGTYAQEAPEHVSADELSWKTFPPASGTHIENWAPWGAYGEQVADGFAVHNLEHGGVVVWLGADTPSSLEKPIVGLLDKGEKWLVAPRSDVEGLVALAWAKALICPPKALEELGDDVTADLVETWFDEVESTGSDVEKDVPAWPGAMTEPEPELDISVEP